MTQDAETKHWTDEYGGLPANSFIDYSIFDLESEDELADIVLPLVTCERCGHLVMGDGSVEAPCRIGDCTEVKCGNCGTRWASWGPVGCACQRRDPKIRRIRQLYRRRSK